MIDDFGPRPKRRKPKIITPLPKQTFQPLPSLEPDVADEPVPQLPEVPVVDSRTSAATVSLLESSHSKSDSAKLGWRKRLRLHWPPTRRQGIALAVVILVLVLGGGVAYAHFRKPAKVNTVATTKKVVAKPKVVAPTTVASTLSGLPVAPAVNQRPVTAVMIENSVDARPQSGLDQAGVVFEAVAEGGVTRFMALFQDTQPDYIGPVRSARPYYISWALGFDAGYAHVGGSPDGLADIKSWGVRDLDQFANSGAYQRISSRYAPHNVYTSIAQLNTLEQAKGYTTSNFTGFTRKAEQPYKAPAAAATTTKTKAVTDTRTPVNSIDMSLSGYYYNPHYDYDAATNTYKRSEDGAPHMELSSAGAQTQIAPKVVIGIVVPESQGALDSSGAFYSNYNPLGSGQAYVFQDGTVTTGTWTKATNNGPLSFTDANGKLLTLDPGQTWITAVTDTSKLTYK